MKLRLNPFRSLTLAGRIVLGATLVSLVLLWVSAASVYVSPQDMPMSGLLGLCFPFFLAGACLMTAVTLIAAPRAVWVPLLGLLLCAGTIRTYCPFNFHHDAPEKTETLLSWNVCLWGTKDDGGFDEAKEHNLIARHIGQSGATIVCIQEALKEEEFLKKHIYPEMPKLKHHLFNSFKDSQLAIITAYPILSSRRLCQSGNNGAMAYWLRLTDGDTLIVVNCHLKSMGLTYDDRSEFSHMVKDPEENLSATAGHTIFSKIKRAGTVRAAMADTIATFLRSQEGKSLVVMGDFNDTPVSYTRQRISRGLTDAFRTTGNGIGRSFNRDAIYVRIDHIFLSSDWKPYNCHVDNRAPYSDHYPIICSIARKK